MENINKAVIICAGIGNWYPHGVKRLEKSLNFVGWAGEVMTWTDYPTPDCPRHEEIPYYMKIAAFEEALKAGFTHICWVDASFYTVRNPMQLFDLINEQGFYFFSSGYNLAQSVNDRALAAVGLSRDEAANVTEWATGCVGINFENPDGQKLYTRWKELMDAGLSIGGRNHDGGSNDPRFLHHRQDQSCFSLAIWELGLSNKRGIDFVSYKNTGYNEKELMFFIEGIG